MIQKETTEKKRTAAENKRERERERGREGEGERERERGSDREKRKRGGREPGRDGEGFASRYCQSCHAGCLLRSVRRAGGGRRARGAVGCADGAGSECVTCDSPSLPHTSGPVLPSSLSQ